MMMYSPVTKSVPGLPPENINPPSKAPDTMIQPTKSNMGGDSVLPELGGVRIAHRGRQAPQRFGVDLGNPRLGNLEDLRDFLQAQVFHVVEAEHELLVLREAVELL